MADTEYESLRLAVARKQGRDEALVEMMTQMKKAGIQGLLRVNVLTAIRRALTERDSNG